GQGGAPAGGPAQAGPGGAPGAGGGGGRRRRRRRRGGGGHGGPSAGGHGGNCMSPYALTPRNIPIRDTFGAIATRYDLTNPVISLGVHLPWRSVEVRMLGEW